MRNQLKFFLASVWFLRSEADRILALSIAFSILLVAAKVCVSGHYYSLFLAWNLFLAWIPYGITQWLVSKPSWIERKWKLVPVFVLWLLFIPNSFYILTDLFHLQTALPAPLWYDLVLIFSFAWNGLLLGVLSVRQMEKIIQLHVQNESDWVFLYPIMWLNALGVYIGRYLRYNSWDAFVNPFGLVTDIAHMVLHPLRYKNAWGMIFCFAVMMILVYQALKKISGALEK